MTQEKLANARIQHEHRVLASWLPPQASLPQLPESAAFELLDRILDAERSLVAPGGTSEEYGVGTAKTPDELLMIDGSSLLLSAEHATTQVRTRKKSQTTFVKEPDYGTAGLAYVLHEELGAVAAIPLGRQTGDANNDTTHPLKDALSGRIKSGGIKAHASLHGARTGLYQSFDDSRGIDIHIGVGAQPSELTVQYADRAKKIAQGFGLKAVVNGPFIINDSFHPLVPRFAEDGTPALRSFAAKNPATTRAHVQATAEQYGLEIATMQVEFSGFLRLQPDDIEPRDRVARAMGVYLGYKVIKETFEG